MLIADKHGVLLPHQPLVTDVGKDEQSSRCGIRRVVLSDDHVQGAIAVHVGDVEAHGTDERGNQMFLPYARRINRLFIPDKIAEHADRLEPDDRVD